MEPTDSSTHPTTADLAQTQDDLIVLEGLEGELADIDSALQELNSQASNQ